MRALCLIVVAIESLRCVLALPDPFGDKPLRIGDVGEPVKIAKELLCRSSFVMRDPECGGGIVDDIFDSKTSAWVNSFQKGNDLPNSGGVIDEDTALAILSLHGEDGYEDDGAAANATGGYRYKILIPVHRNRSIQTNGTFLDASNKVIFTFPVRAKGHEADNNGHMIPSTWPDYNGTGDGLNQFSHSGMTPTGLSEIDLNSPEDNATLYGPYPVTRFVRGLAGNAKFLIPSQRNGILIHTGEWPDFDGTDMPNSAGCVHTLPHFVEQIWTQSVSEGAVVRPNSNGKLPYPWKGQGLASVFTVDRQ